MRDVRGGKRALERTRSQVLKRAARRANHLTLRTYGRRASFRMMMGGRMPLLVISLLALLSIGQAGAERLQVE